MTSFVAALGALAVPGALHAQAYQCRMPSVSAVPKVAPSSQRREMPVTGYTMALSWSPEFCKPRADSRSHKTQCSGDNGRFALVVHGLWPEGVSKGRRSWPQWCAASQTLTPQEVRRNMCMMPSARLVARQWAKHGTCMTKRPATYFKITRILWDSYRIPEYDRISREDGLTAGRIRKAFAAANPGIPASAVGVKLNKRGWLQELRICYGKRFMPARCDAARLGASDATKAKIWRGM